jgi:hypothetical protein
MPMEIGNRLDNSCVEWMTPAWDGLSAAKPAVLSRPAQTKPIKPMNGKPVDYTVAKHQWYDSPAWVSARMG